MRRYLDMKSEISRLAAHLTIHLNQVLISASKFHFWIWFHLKKITWTLYKTEFSLTCKTNFVCYDHPIWPLGQAMLLSHGYWEAGPQ